MLYELDFSYLHIHFLIRPGIRDQNSGACCCCEFILGMPAENCTERSMLIVRSVIVQGPLPNLWEEQFALVVPESPSHSTYLRRSARGVDERA